MSAADDTIEYMLDGHMEERACRAFMRAEMSQSELRERVGQRRFCDQRFERFFRTDGKTPEWGFCKAGIVGTVEWVGIDEMPKGKIARIAAALERPVGGVEIEDKRLAARMRETVFGRLMTLPDMIRPNEMFKGEFPDSTLWVDAAAVVFRREIERRAVQGRHW